SRGPGHGEYHLASTWNHVADCYQHGEREVDIRRRQRAAARLAQYRFGDREALRIRRGLANKVHKENSARVGVFIDKVAESRNPLAAPEQFANRAHRIGWLSGAAEHGLGAERGAAVQRPAYSAEPGADDGIR